MTSVRKLAILAGISYLITHVTSVVALILYGPVLNDANFIFQTSADAENSVLGGAFLEVILVFAIVATAVTLYPVVKKQNEAVALGYVGLRTLEASMISVGIITLLAIVTLRGSQVGPLGIGTSPDDLRALGRALLAIHNWTFLVGPGFTSGVDTVLMAYLMFKSNLVPRFIPILGLIGGLRE